MNSKAAGTQSKEASNHKSELMTEKTYCLCLQSLLPICDISHRAEIMNRVIGIIQLISVSLFGPDKYMDGLLQQLRMNKNYGGR